MSISDLFVCMHACVWKSDNRACFSTNPYKIMIKLLKFLHKYISENGV